ncbi:hypothetical protein [Candidatus Parabeggiatoa sp. HSG14]|uniref:hypothetical protein n=1 Tax=Candidatus Parabeggiatoa sp. HSG14 TaxID=3055593 RepID=UPI0025A90CF9|nr:hypothetical protein [Thiotrichales bacterium HSG14]
MKPTKKPFPPDIKERMEALLSSIRIESENKKQMNEKSKFYRVTTCFERELVLECRLTYTLMVFKNVNTREEKKSVETSQEFIQNEEFKERHRKSKTAFTRVRKLYFPLVLVF